MKETQEKKNPFVFVGGVCSAVPAGSSKKDAIVCSVPSSRKHRLHGIIARYKSGLDDCAVNISSSDNFTAKFMDGHISLASIGTAYGVGAPAFSMFPLPGKKPVISGSGKFLIELISQATPINARDVHFTLVLEEVE